MRAVPLSALCAATAYALVGGPRGRPVRAAPVMGVAKSPSADAVAKIASTPYDYVIAGGGTAGCVLANRLSADGTKKVLVLERGTSNPSDPRVRIPVAILKLFKSAWDYAFATEKNAHVNGRSLYVCRGRGLGGSSLTNVMLYNRGTADDYDKWAAAAGDESWGADAMLGYFKKAEDCLVPGLKDSKYHGTGGPYASSHVPYVNEMSTAFVLAAVADGGAANPDFNDWSTSQEGYGKFVVSQRRGERVNGFNAYLKPALGRDNLDVVTGACVEGVAFDDAKVATGVTFSVGGASATVKAGEVLLTGGAINSPQLLMLSGVGAKAELDALGIPVVADRRGVGKNLQDHPACLVSWKGSEKARGKSHSTALRVTGTTLTNPIALLKWAFGRGPLTSMGCDHGGFAKLGAGAAGAPDTQFRFLATKSITADGMSTIADDYGAAADHPDGVTIQTIVARPVSHGGSVTLASRDASAAPLVNDAYLSDARDVDVMVAALKKARRIGASAPLNAYAGEEEFPGASVTDDGLADYVRDTAHTANALVGTCALGKAEDLNAVVDGNLNVIGVKNLRVVDASIMPTLPGGQTASSTVAVAEKAADLILA